MPPHAITDHAAITVCRVVRRLNVVIGFKGIANW